MNNRLKPISRILAVLCSIGLIAVLFVPLWQIELSAPQYPEGLVLKIYPDKLGGDVEVINGLNHYIGMRTLHAEDFIEFTILKYIIGTLAVFGFLSVMINRKWFFVSWVVFFIVFGIVAMVDFYRWEYNYGHNLDDSAAIKVPGMSYQPPLIGYKKLLNFGAYSIPDIGGWIFIVVGLLLAFALVLELRNTVKITRSFEIKTTAISVLMICTLNSCQSGTQPIKYGTDGCDFCKMTISDRRFGGEILTQKGKVYKFDDSHCLTDYLKSNFLAASDIKEVYLVDFANQGKLIPTGESLLIKSEELRSPMGGNIAAFSQKDSLEKYKQLFSGELISWEQAKK
jgi:copper chaperone NosL